MRLIYDDLNSRIRRGGTIGTLTSTVGNAAPRNGFKIIEINDTTDTETDQK